MSKSLQQKFASPQEAIDCLPAWMRKSIVVKKAPVEWELNWQAIGEIVRTRREQSGLSLRSAARWMSVSPTYLSDLERGLRPWSTARLQDVSDVLEMAESIHKKK